MGQAKKRLMDYEHSFSVIEGLINIYSNEIFESIVDNEIILQLIDLRDRIRSLDNNTMHTNELISEIINEEYHFVYSELSRLIDSVISDNEPISNTDLDKFRTLTGILQTEIRKTNALLNNYISKTQNIYNSEKYYDERIRELENQRNELQSYLIQQKDIVGKTNEKNVENIRLIKEKEMALLKAKEQIKQYQTELEEKKKKENAIVEWNSKIKSTFDELTVCLTPMKDEHTRLQRMFWIYSILTILVIITIISLEFYIFCKLHNSTTFPEWENYFAAITPIPVFGGLLWAFIIQLNRTQRQLLILAKHIHEIKYVEGLLLSINSFSLDINDSTKRVNLAIDRLLENHLNSNNNSNSLTEQGIIQEEKKDYVPIDSVLKLLKETKGIIGK
jgi:hypothetical protein